jgi:hypothetical protein
MKRFVALLLTGLFLVSAAGPAFGKTGQPNPQPPKCVPANTPGCS